MFEYPAETTPKMNKGSAIPTPNNTKPSKFSKKLLTELETANRTTSEAGLHGKTTIPKNNPNKIELTYGFDTVGDCTCGIYLENSKPNINIKDIIPNIKNAIGETISITDVSETCKNFVKISPTKNILSTTPSVTKELSFKSSTLLDLSSTSLELTCPAK